SSKAKRDEPAGKQADAHSSSKQTKDGTPYLYYACVDYTKDGSQTACPVKMLPARELEASRRGAKSWSSTWSAVANGSWTPASSAAPCRTSSAWSGCSRWRTRRSSSSCCCTRWTWRPSSTSARRRRRRRPCRTTAAPARRRRRSRDGPSQQESAPGGTACGLRSTSSPTCRTPRVLTSPGTVRDLGELAPRRGFEPRTYRLTAGRSTVELSGNGHPSLSNQPRRRRAFSTAANSANPVTTTIDPSVPQWSHVSGPVYLVW